MPRKKPDAPSPGFQALFDAYWNVLEYAPVSAGREAKAIKELYTQGCTPDELVALYRHYKSADFWQDKHLSAHYLAEHYPAWKQAQPAEPRNEPESDRLLRLFRYLMAVDEAEAAAWTVDQIRRNPAAEAIFLKERMYVERIAGQHPQTRPTTTRPNQTDTRAHIFDK